MIDQTLLTLVLGSLIAPLVLAMVPRILEQRREDRRELRDFLDQAADLAVVSVEQEYAQDPYRATPEGKQRRRQAAVLRFKSFARTRNRKLDAAVAAAYVEAAVYKRRAGLDGREAFSAPPFQPSALTVNTGTSEFRGDTP